MGTGVCFRQPAGSRAWKIADLVWVVLGGFGALVAVLAGIYNEDSGRIARQIDIAYTATHEFDNDAARFRLRQCISPEEAYLHILCEKVEFLSASTAENSDLPLFISVSKTVAPLQGLRLFFGGKNEEMDYEIAMEEIEAFEMAEFLEFDPRDPGTRDALGRVRGTLSVVAADFQILADAYDELIHQVRILHDEWALLQAGSGILLLQTIALCLVAFAAPFRLGKSIVELGHDKAP